jgi:hypothetical protein
MRILTVLSCCSFLMLVSGCKTQCRQLTEKQCECTANNSEFTSCLQQAANKENTGLLLTQADEDLCESLLPQCDCRLVDTPQGKQRCGLAVAADAGF